jgi:hypothetical protein
MGCPSVRIIGPCRLRRGNRPSVLLGQPTGPAAGDRKEGPRTPNTWRFSALRSVRCAPAADLFLALSGKTGIADDLLVAEVCRKIESAGVVSRRRGVCGVKRTVTTSSAAYRDRRSRNGEPLRPGRILLAVQATASGKHTVVLLGIRTRREPLRSPWCANVLRYVAVCPLRFGLLSL